MYVYVSRLQPTEDEIDMYRSMADRRQDLHPVDQFMLELCEIPHLSLRIDVCLTLWDFPWQLDSTSQVTIATSEPSLYSRIALQCFGSK